MGVEYVLTRLYNERNHKGLLAYHELGDSIRQASRARHAARDFFDAVADWQAKRGATNGRLRRPLPVADPLSEELRKLATAIGRESEEIEAEEQRIELGAAAERLDAMADGLTAWLAQETPEESVHWIELEGSRRVILARAPLEVGPTLKRELFDRVPTCILTSATLAIGSPPGFAFAKSRLGLTQCEALQLGSPYDYRSQVTFHIPRDLPDPSEAPKDFERRAIGAIRHYLEKTHGKAFVLFTSYRMMDEAARALDPLAGRAEHRPVFPGGRPAPLEDDRGVQGGRR